LDPCPDPDLLIRGSDPDSYQNVTDPQNCFFLISFAFFMIGSGSVQIIAVLEHRYKDDLSSTVQEGKEVLAAGPEGGEARGEPPAGGGPAPGPAARLQEGARQKQSPGSGLHFRQLALCRQGKEFE
jgi:hypothetical protein